MANPVELTAQDSAKEGATVNVSATVTNTLEYHSSFWTRIWAVPDQQDVVLIFELDEAIQSGLSKTYTTAFTMPGGNVTVLAWVERWAFDHWEYWGQDSKYVILEVDVPLPSSEFGSLGISSLAKV